MKKSFLALCALTLSVGFVRADDVPTAPLPTEAPTASQITERWRAYFGALEKLPSWTYAAHLGLWSGDLKNPTAPLHLASEMKYKFAKDKNLFRRELQVRESEKADFQKLIASYNGQKYQFMVHNPKAENINGHMMKDLMQQSPKPIAGDATNDLTMHFALTMPFLFAGKETDDMSWTFLAKPAAWDDVQKRITKIEPSTWENHPGFLITILPPADDSESARVEVFMESESGLPLHTTSISKATGVAKGELKIKTWQSATLSAPAFPLFIEISGVGTAKKPATKGAVEIERALLNFAPTFAPDYFKIPMSAVEIITEGDKIVYSRYPMPKETAPKTAKPTKKPTTKTPAKTKQK